MKEQLNLTSMIDMLTILLVFMVTNYASQVMTDVEGSNVVVPAAKAAGTIESKFRLEFDGNILKEVGKGEIKITSLPVDQSVLLEASSKVPFSKVRKVLQELNAHGIQKVELAVVPEELQ